MGVVGSDVAINAADVALMNDDLMKIPESIILARKTKAIVLQCFGIWGVTNVVGLSLVSFGVLTPTGAATYNFLTDFLPIFNALRVGMRKI
jgi:cation transport ATPase